MGGVAVMALAVAIWVELATSAMATWRVVVAALFIPDIAAGAVANFTRGTTEYYGVVPAECCAD